MAMKIAEMFYTLRNRVRQSGESVPNFVGFSGSSGMKIPFSTLKNKRTVSDQKVDGAWRMERIRASLKRIRAQHADLFAVLQPLAEHYELDTIYDTPGGRELVWDRQPDEADAQSEDGTETTTAEKSAPAHDETKADTQSEESLKEEQTVSARTRPRPASSPTSKLDWGDGDLDEEIRRAIEQHTSG